MPPNQPYFWWLTERAPLQVTIQEQLTMADGGALQLRFDADDWDSLITFDPGIPVQLGGTLELAFEDDVHLASQVGRTYRVFDWTGVTPTGEFQVVSDYAWDTSRLYSTGEVTLTTVPEPGTFVLAALLAASCFFTRRRIVTAGNASNQIKMVLPVYSSRSSLDDSALLAVRASSHI